MIITLVYLWSLISIATSTAVSEDGLLEECPIWFKRNTKGSCECGSELEGIVKCDADKQVVSLMVGNCMSLNHDSTEELVVGFNNGQCLDHTIHGGFDHAYKELPANISQLCSERKQRGLLCGECMDKYGPCINCLYSRCLQCKALHATFICLLMMLLLTIFYVIVVVFHLNITSGAMLGYTIFCQMFFAVLRSNVGLFYSIDATLSSFGSIVLRISMGMSAMWWYFILIFHSFPLTCLSQHMTRLQVVSMEYVLVLYPLFLLIVTYVLIELHARDFRLVIYLWKPFHKCFVKVRRNWSASDSIIHAYATFFFLSFTILTFTSFNLLRMTNIYNINGTVVKTVLVYEPTMKGFSRHHLPYAIAAITLLFLLGFCPTLFLCLYSTRLFTRCFRLCPRKQLLLHTFADTFQCCYKDGLNGTYDYRFLSPVPMVLYLSIVFVSVHSSNVDVDLSYMLLYSAVFLMLSFAIAYVKPYKSGYMNFSLSFHSAIIGFGICVIILWMDGHTISSHVVAEVFTLLAALPHLFALMTAVYYILNRVRLTRSLIQLSYSKISAIFCLTEEGNTREPLPDRLENSACYRTLPNNV